MKKIILVVFTVLLLACGCDSMMNTPTKKVEEFLNKYQRQDEEVLSQLDTVMQDGDYDFTDEQTSSYKELMKKQYQNLTYTIKEEMIDGDNATVTVEIEVFDFNKAISEAEEYYTTHNDEFKDETGAMDQNKYMDYRIEHMGNTTDKIKYTLNLTLTKQDKTWVLNDITEMDRQKIHGLYNS